MLEQPLDVIELDLRALRIGQAAAELFENPAHPLHIDFAGNFYRQVVAELAPVQRPPQGIALVAAALLSAGAIAWTVALSVAVALLHGFSQTLGALAQRIQRLALRIRGGMGVTLAEPAAGVAHRVVGFAEAVLVIGRLRIAVLALLTLL